MAALTCAGLGLEMLARYGLGLGDPPLYVRDADIGYMYKPSALYQRFGKTIAFNEFGMRSHSPPSQKAACEIRILAVGDSILNGGTMLSNEQLASNLLEARLQRDLQRPVWVGNVSVGGWAPENMRAYLARFGWNTADVVIFVLSSHDVDQGTAFTPDLGVDFPTRSPRLALEEAVQRYLPRYLPFLASRPDEAVLSANAGRAPAAEEQKPPKAVLRALFEEAVRRTGLVLVVHNREVTEQAAQGGDSLRLQQGKELRTIALAAGAHYLDFGPAEQNPDLPESAYRDGIHLSGFGQQLLADVLHDELGEFLGRVVARQPPECGSVEAAART